MGEIRDVIKGSKAPLQWLFSGRKPVDKFTSLSRAGTCIFCPLNGVGPLTQWFTEPVANLIQKAIEKRKGYKMETLYDAALGVCEACHCVLTLKVHEPIDLVLKHLSPEVEAKLWDRCWIRREKREASEPTPTEES